MEMVHSGHEDRHVTWCLEEEPTRCTTTLDCGDSKFGTSRISEESVIRKDRGESELPGTDDEIRSGEYHHKSEVRRARRCGNIRHFGVGDNATTRMHHYTQDSKYHLEKGQTKCPVRFREGSKSEGVRIHGAHQGRRMAWLAQQNSPSPKKREIRVQSKDHQHSAHNGSHGVQSRTTRARIEIDSERITGESCIKRCEIRRPTELQRSFQSQDATEIFEMGAGLGRDDQERTKGREGSLGLRSKTCHRTGLAITSETSQRTGLAIGENVVSEVCVSLRSLLARTKRGPQTRPCMSRRDQRFLRCLGQRCESTTWAEASSKCWTTDDMVDWKLHAPSIGVLHTDLFVDMNDTLDWILHDEHQYRSAHAPYWRDGLTKHIDFPTSSLSADQNAILLEQGLAEYCTAPRGFGYLFSVAEQQKKRLRVITDTLSCNVLMNDVPSPAFSSMAEVRNLVHRGRWAVTTDFKAWYYQFEMDPSIRPYLSYKVAGKFFQFRRLPMGYKNAVSLAHSTAVWLAQLALQPGVTYDVYIDNVVFISDSYADLMQVRERFLAICHRYNATLGECSMPATSATYRGLSLDFKNKSVRLGDSFVNKFSSRYETSWTTWDQHRSLISSVVSAMCMLGISLSSCYYLLKFASKHALTSPTSRVTLWTEAKMELRILAARIRINASIPIHRAPLREVTIISDACGETHTGASVTVFPGGKMLQRVWDMRKLPSASINDQECWALWLTLESSGLRNTVVHYVGDNQAMLYGLQPELAYELRDRASLQVDV